MCTSIADRQVIHSDAQGQGACEEQDVTHSDMHVGTQVGGLKHS